ncbi:transporter substrate-binding domain-containing protein [Thalassotalea marina]|uniref:transporter substrate-binding domain-containing protein n=1 Tax=Thalassotalea marina TaxID=1673741 RepID=UPI00167C3DAE|nr:transporter substrate-binding domain-containing protein [Thalassotalea marina]
MQRILYLILTLTLISLSYENVAFGQSFKDRPITIAVNKTSYPYHYQAKNGEATGINVDLWKLWAEKQGVDVKFKVLTWNETIEQVASGQIDIHAGLASTQERLEKFLFTNPFFIQDNYIYVHREYSHIKSLDKVQPLTVGIVAGSSHVDVIKRNYPNFNLKYYASRFDLFDGALKGEIAAFTNLERLSSNYPRVKELQLLFPAYKRMLFFRNDYGSAVSANNPELLKFIEQGLAKITPQERSAIEKHWLGLDKNTNALALVYSPDLLPYMAISSTGRPTGLFIDIWRAWSEHTGQPVEFVPQSFENAVELVKSGGADILIAYPEHLVESSGLRVADRTYRVDIKAYAQRDANQQLPILNASTVGRAAIFKDAPYIKQLQERFPKLELELYETFAAMSHDLELGMVQFIFGAGEIMEDRIVKANLQTNLSALSEVYIELDMFSMTDDKNQRLAEIIREGFALIPQEQLMQLERKWLSNASDGYFKLKQLHASLSEHEQAWVEQHRDIKIGFIKNWAPVEFEDENGEVVGINADINKLVQRRTGIHFSYVAYDNWNDMLQALVKHDIDIVASASETEDRKKRLLFSDSYWGMPWVVIHRRERGEQLTIKSFYGSELAVVKGYQLIDKIRKEHPSITLRLVDSHEEGVLAVQRGVVAGFIENIASASELIKRESLVTLGLSVADTLSVDTHHYAIRKDWPELKSIINKALATISAAERKFIYEKWFEINLETGLDRNVVLRVGLQIGAIILIVIVVIVVWNRRLYVEIQMRKTLEEKMKHMATHDELTGLANRVLLKDRLNLAINFHQRNERLLAVLFIDLDGFKTVNDTHGHDVGDELLQQVAQRLSGCIRKSDTVVRFGGDEFVLLLTGLHNKNEASFIAEKVLKIVQQTFHLSVGQANIGCSIGIAMYPFDGKTESDLLKVADTLMYKVKAAGKNHYVFNS